MGKKQESVSISGAPTIEFDFLDATDTDFGCRRVAELAGAMLLAEVNPDGTIDMTVDAADGFRLAHLVLKARPGRNATQNVTDIGSALLWSHWRHQQAVRSRNMVA